MVCEGREYGHVPLGPAHDKCKVLSPEWGGGIRSCEKARTSSGLAREGVGNLLPLAAFQQG